jgi:hypothetical protein
VEASPGGEAVVGAPSLTVDVAFRAMVAVGAGIATSSRRGAWSRLEDSTPTADAIPVFWERIEGKKMA